MIIHSIIPIDEIFKNNEEEFSVKTKIIEINGVKLEVCWIKEDIYELQRIHSTSPQDYLNPELQPGIKIKGSF